MGTFCVLFIMYMLSESNKEHSHRSQPVIEKEPSGWWLFWFIVLFFPVLWIIGIVLNALMVAFGLNK